MNDPIRDVELLHKAGYALVFLDTGEEERAESLLWHLADKLKLSYFIWTRTKGLRRPDRADSLYGTLDLGGACGHMEASRFAALYHVEQPGADLTNAEAATHLKDAAEMMADVGGLIVCSGPGPEIPESLKPLSATVRLPGPTPADYRQLLTRIVQDLSAKMPVKVEISATDANRLLGNLRGFTLMEAEKILTKAIVEDGRLSREDIQAVVDAKKSVIEREGVLEYYPAQEGLSDIADLAGLKGWLAQRRQILVEPDRAKKFGLTFPKGILLLGVQGCGKSLCAKAVSHEWGLPLLKMDPSALYNKFIGETERNFRRAMEVAERMAPIVLWIDEIEKAFVQGSEDQDGGVSRRVFGTFLGWMQDRKGDVFIVATANDIQRLPPEFLRKGRFDEIFFVDLPVPEARRAVFEIHLKRRGKDPARFELDALVRDTEGFSGAEIEQAVVSGLYAAFAAKTELDSKLLLAEVRKTKPLSVTMGDKIGALREWAKDKTVAAQ